MNKNNLIQTDPLPSPCSMLEQLPLRTEEAAFITKTRQEIVRILDRDDPRHLLIVGPCSIHDLSAALEYAERLGSLSRAISDQFLVIMRVYFDKPRTIMGWKGLLGDPHLDGSHAIEEGLRLSRQLLLKLAEMRIPTAAEFLDPASSYYLGDLISWGCIGARTSESQTHRQMASALSMPVAFKNSTSGNVDVAIHGILAASHPHTFIGLNGEGQVARVRSGGNPHCHLALRGGEGKPNYDSPSITATLEKLQRAKLPSRLIVDCSHDNSNRKAEQQLPVFQSLIRQIVDGEEAIRGLILESHLVAGNQPLLSDKTKLKYAVSLTDPCLDWMATERLIRWGYEQLCKKRRVAAAGVLLKIK